MEWALWPVFLSSLFSKKFGENYMPISTSSHTQKSKCLVFRKRKNDLWDIKKIQAQFLRTETPVRKAKADVVEGMEEVGK